MTILQRKQQLIQQITSITDEEILAVLEEELSFYLKAERDITSELTPEELDELISVANEPDKKDTTSLDDFKKATERWRTK